MENVFFAESGGCGYLFQSNFEFWGTQFGRGFTRGMQQHPEDMR